MRCDRKEQQREREGKEEIERAVKMRRQEILREKIRNEEVETENK